MFCKSVPRPVLLFLVFASLWGCAGPSVDVRAHSIPMKFTDGKTRSLHDFRGKPVLLDFWASWCGPCQQLSPVVERISKKYAGRGLAVIGVDSQDGEGLGKAREHAKTYGITHYLTLSDELAGAFELEGLPTLVLLDANGKIAYRDVGYSVESERLLEDAIDKVLKP